MPAKNKTPVRREVIAATARSRPGQTVWGLTLVCGHYVESHIRPDMYMGVTCPDCTNGARPVAPRLVPCGACNIDSQGRGAPGCGACRGFGRVEEVIPPLDLVNGPKPGMAPGDHILAFWIANLNGDLITTCIAKRGRVYIGEHMRASVPGTGGLTPNVTPSPTTRIEHKPGGIMVVRDRFFPCSSESQEVIIENTENAVEGMFDRQAEAFAEAGVTDYVLRRAFAQLRTTDRARAVSLESALTDRMVEGR